MTTGVAGVSLLLLPRLPVRSRQPQGRHVLVTGDSEKRSSTSIFTLTPGSGKRGILTDLSRNAQLPLRKDN